MNGSYLKIMQIFNPRFQTPILFFFALPAPPPFDHCMRWKGLALCFFTFCILMIHPIVHLLHLMIITLIPLKVILHKIIFVINLYILPSTELQMKPNHQP